MHSSSTGDKCVFDVELHGNNSSSTSSPDARSSSSSTPNDADVDDEPEDSSETPCFVAGHIDVTNNWYGYIGVLKLRPAVASGDAAGPSARSSIDVAPNSNAADSVRYRRPPRLYFRFVYPVTDADGRCCRSLSVVLYNEDQFDKLRVRMNCIQRMAVVLNPTLTSATATAAQQHLVTLYELIQKYTHAWISANHEYTYT